MDNIALIVGYGTIGVTCIIVVLVLVELALEMFVKHVIGMKAFYNAYGEYLQNHPTLMTEIEALRAENAKLKTAAGESKDK